MPYIKANDGRREALRNGDTARSAGELNYQIFYHIKNCKESKELICEIRYFVLHFLGEKPNYQRYNDMTGALIRCEKEVKRRLGLDIKYLYDIMEHFDDQIASYEDLKIAENGDVE